MWEGRSRLRVPKDSVEFAVAPGELFLPLLHDLLEMGVGVLGRFERLLGLLE